MVTVNAQRRRGASLPPARVAAETCEHELHHVALAVVRRRRVGKNEQFHF
jgi:hypothetical protein